MPGKDEGVGRRESGTVLAAPGTIDGVRAGSGSGAGMALGRRLPEEPGAPGRVDDEGKTDGDAPRARGAGSRAKVGGGTNARRAIVSHHSANLGPTMK
jgi:hypothetical protein